MQAEVLTYSASVYTSLSQLDMALIYDKRRLSLDQRLGNGHDTEMDLNHGLTVPVGPGKQGIWDDRLYFLAFLFGVNRRRC